MNTKLQPIWQITKAALLALFAAVLIGFALWTVLRVGVPWFELWMGREMAVFRPVSAGESRLVLLLAGAVPLLIVAALVWRPAGRWLNRPADSDNIWAELAFAARPDSGCVRARCLFR